MQHRHYPERGGGYNVPLRIRRVTTREVQDVTIGGTPHDRRWAVVASRRPSSWVARFEPDTLQLGTENAWEQVHLSWTTERTETVTDGPNAPEIVEYGYYTRYHAWYWSTCVNERDARREAAGRMAEHATITAAPVSH